MPTEIEKKYRLTAERAESLRARLRELAGEAARGTEFEENTIYAGAGLGPGLRALRLRRVGGRAVLTLKEREASADAIKRQRELETVVADADVIDAILR
ncbi:MAG: CYTH domain-containing protein, partial [Acidobacteriota bacterium]|nr:CYTH domain-containing protein [Acidobacteriota bacterium]